MQWLWFWAGVIKLQASAPSNTLFSKRYWGILVGNDNYYFILCIIDALVITGYKSTSSWEALSHSVYSFPDHCGFVGLIQPEVNKVDVGVGM